MNLFSNVKNKAPQTLFLYPSPPEYGRLAGQGPANSVAGQEEELRSTSPLLKGGQGEYFFSGGKEFDKSVIKKQVCRPLTVQHVLFLKLGHDF